MSLLLLQCRVCPLVTFVLWSRDTKGAPYSHLNSMIMCLVSKESLDPAAGCWLKQYVNRCVKMFSTIFTNFSIQLTQIGPKMASLSILDPKFTVHARVKPLKLGGRFCKERSCKGWILKLLKYSTLVSHNFGKRVTLREQ